MTSGHPKVIIMTYNLHNLDFINVLIYQLYILCFILTELL